MDLGDAISKLETFVWNLGDLCKLVNLPILRRSSFLVMGFLTQFEQWVN